MIEQPQLGQKLLELRKAKGMTQQELRDFSFVSVRTIQRIESGAVTPRISTVKIMLEALGEKPDVWFDSPNQSSIFSIKTIKKMLLINSTESDLKNALAPAWIAGAVYLVLIVVEIGMGALIEDEPEVSPFLMSYLGLKVAIVVAFFLYNRGFIALSILFEIHLLKIAAYLSIIILTVNYFLEIGMLLTNPDWIEMPNIINAFFILPYGAVAIILGIALLRLQDSMGRVAKVAGVLEIIMGVSLASFILSFLAIVLLVPVIIVEIVLLSKADVDFKRSVVKTNFDS